MLGRALGRALRLHVAVELQQMLPQQVGPRLLTMHVCVSTEVDACQDPLLPLRSCCLWERVCHAVIERAGIKDKA